MDAVNNSHIYMTFSEGYREYEKNDFGLNETIMVDFKMYSK